MGWFYDEDIHVSSASHFISDIFSLSCLSLLIIFAMVKQLNHFRLPLSFRPDCDGFRRFNVYQDPESAWLLWGYGYLHLLRQTSWDNGCRDGDTAFTRHEHFSNSQILHVSTFYRGFAKYLPFSWRISLYFYLICSTILTSFVDFTAWSLT